MRSRFSILLALLILSYVAAVSQEAPFAFVMLTDPQFGMYANNKEFVRETANYEFAVATVNRVKPGFMIVLGDLVNKDRDPGQIREFLRISKKNRPGHSHLLRPRQS